RLAYELANGVTLPLDRRNQKSTVHVCHSCDNPPCCNPAHLWLGTMQQNIGDAAQKGRIAHGHRSGGSKLTADDISAIRLCLSSRAESQRRIAKRFGVCQQTVGDIATGRTWKHV